MIDFSIIIPHKDSLGSLKKLLYSIPDEANLEIIVVDNSSVPIKKEDVNVEREFQLFWSNPDLFAGGARNLGIEHSQGKWLLFADADDYFSENAFDIFYSYVNSDADIVFFCADSIYSDTGERAHRGDIYTNMVRDFLRGALNENSLRFGFGVPWAKMIKSNLVKMNGLKYDEVIASNDIYFSLQSGFYAKSIEAVDEMVYIVTVSKGSLTRRRDRNVVFSRYKVALRYNYFLREHGFPQFQMSVMSYFINSAKFGIKEIPGLLKLLIDYNQNPFVGWKNWIRTIINSKKKSKVEGRYITY